MRNLRRSVVSSFAVGGVVGGRESRWSIAGPLSAMNDSTLVKEKDEWRRRILGALKELRRDAPLSEAHMRREENPGGSAPQEVQRARWTPVGGNGRLRTFAASAQDQDDDHARLPVALSVAGT
jgi:hypothetical protein